MTKKVYRTSQGKSVDIGALMLQNETVRAVGNMGINARGDRINSQNSTVDARNSRIGKQYKKQVSNVVDDRVSETKHDQPKVSIKEKKNKVKNDVKENVKIEEELFTVKSTEAQPVIDDPVVEEPTVKEPAPAPVGGLADAIARARTVKQEPMKTPRQQAQLKSGVRKI